MRIINLVLLFCFTASLARGQSDTVKHKYTLFNPVPRDKMKEMETDRPDVTESAYTVEAGHFQVETDLFKQIRVKADGVQSIQTAYNVANYKLGLTEKMDIQLVVPTYVINTTRDVATQNITDKAKGFDDITLRFKYNLWGSGGGNSALAILPFVSLPTSSFASNGVQGGITFPFALAVTEKTSFGAQATISFVKEDNNRYYTNMLYSFTFGHPLFKQLDGFVEGVATYSPYSKTTDTYANGGLIFSANSNLNIDAGLNYGLNKSAGNIYFIGFSFRY
ncbi:transporter [Mucilaginibacter gilvus]|uniref:Transporter n=1 Tax=Mucilaginibacter gilvus TaxID=2305909 RepID=A0A444MHE0_9SPHI|nr:transporter [Mucilaginibacter gilvus]RWY46229.1 transporter [Mucilaginibacter gilvus]